MPKTLTLLRHAKSSWDDFNLQDFDRPLAPRGIKAAPLIGKYLFEQSLMPDLVLCSPAKRTRETLARSLPRLPKETEIRFDKMIYSAGMGGSVIELVKTVSDDFDHILIVGHNPTMQELALSLPAWEEGQHKIHDKICRKFSTCAVASLEFDFENWEALAFGKARLTHFITPKILANGKID